MQHSEEQTDMDGLRRDLGGVFSDTGLAGPQLISESHCMCVLSAALGAQQLLPVRARLSLSLFLSQNFGFIHTSASHHRRKET